MNGMCVLQEAKLAALASKRWEHQLKEQSVQTEASRDLMIWAHLCSVADLGAQGETSSPTIQKEMALAIPGSKGNAPGPGSPNLLQNPTLGR